MAGCGQVVGHHQNGHLQLVPDLGQHLQDAQRQRRIERADRLVAHEQAGRRSQGPRDRGSLSLPPGELPGQRLGRPAVEAHAFEQFQRGLAASPARGLAAETLGHLGADAEPRGERRSGVLEDQLGLQPLGPVHRAAVGLEQAASHPQQRRLAAAALAHDGHGSSLRHAQAHSGHGMQSIPARTGHPERLVHVVDRQDRLRARRGLHGDRPHGSGRATPTTAYGRGQGVDAGEQHARTRPSAVPGATRGSCWWRAHSEVRRRTPPGVAEGREARPGWAAARSPRRARAGRAAAQRCRDGGARRGCRLLTRPRTGAPHKAPRRGRRSRPPHPDHG